MRRILKKIMFVVCIPMLILTGCSKDDTAKIIPANANMVVSLDMMKIALEGDLLNSPLFDEASRMLQINPLDMGIDFTEPLYLFQMGEGVFGLTATIGDAGDLEECLNNYAKENIAKKTTEKDGLTWSRILGEVNLAYNANTILLLTDIGGSSSNAKRAMKEMFELKEEDSFFATEDFKKMQENASSDISVYVNLACVPEDIRSPYRFLLPDDAKFSDVKATATLDAEDGLFVATTNVYSDVPQVQAAIDSSLVSLQKLSGSLISQIPQNASLVLMAGVHGKELFQFIKKNTTLSEYLILAAIGTSTDVPELIANAEGDVMICVGENGLDVWTNGLKTSITKGEPCDEVKKLKWSKGEITDYCLFGVVDFTVIDNTQLSKEIPLPSIYDLVNDIECMTIASKGKGDLTLKLYSLNDENIFKQLLH